MRGKEKKRERERGREREREGEREREKERGEENGINPTFTNSDAFHQRYDVKPTSDVLVG